MSWPIKALLLSLAVLLVGLLAAGVFARREKA